MHGNHQREDKPANVTVASAQIQVPRTHLSYITFPAMAGWCNSGELHQLSLQVISCYVHNAIQQNGDDLKGMNLNAQSSTAPGDGAVMHDPEPPVLRLSKMHSNAVPLKTN